MDLKGRLYYKMKLIRETEIAIEHLFSEGKLRGTTHGSRGQESVPAVMAEFIDPTADFICGGHRSHGHLLSLFPEVKPLIAELMGKTTGYVLGKGGSQHVQYRNFFCNGITGGMVPVAVGLAFAQKVKQANNITISFFGDGAMNEGYVMEAFNLAAVYALPILFVLENNSYAMSTSIQDSIKASFAERIKGFGIDYSYFLANDVMVMYNNVKEIVDNTREMGKPHFLEFKTHRFSGHSKSDNRDYIPSDLDAYWIENDPITKIEKSIDENPKKQIIQKIKNDINMAIEEALNDQYPSI